MRSQTDFQLFGGARYPVFETARDGSLRSRNNPPDEIQRPVITDRQDAMFTVYVELASCVHGTLTPGGVPASLIIFQYEIHCLQDNHVVNSLKTELEFAQTGTGSPIVIAYVPYIQRTFHATTGTVDHSHGFEIAAGVEFAPAMADIRYSAEKGKSHEQEYFDKVESGRHYRTSEKRHHSVWWRYSHNPDQNHGIVPAFRTGILLRRADTKPFCATLSLELDAGFRYKAGRKVKDFFGRQTEEEDDVINFDPSVMPFPSDTTIDSTSLGKLAKEAMLDKNLGPIWGVDIGKEVS